MKHNHSDGASPQEIAAFADALFRRGEPLPRIAKQNSASLQYSAAIPIVKAELNYTRGKGRWQDREWETVPAQMNARRTRVTAQVPPEATAWYINLFDKHGAVVSSEHHTR
jgi:hypothetical protein